MTKAEVTEAIHQVIQEAVQESGGNWKRGYRRHVEDIFMFMGKLSPEPNSGNIREEVPNYNKHLIKKVGRQKISSTPEQQSAARALLRKMGLI